MDAPEQNLGDQAGAGEEPDGKEVSIDLTELLREWTYESGHINVRVISGEDGLPKIQMRVDLGVLQMEVSGRPDGLRPHGCESLLEYHEMRLDGEPIDGDTFDDDAPEPSLSPEDCRVLREEAVQYYHRYLALLVLADYEGVVRDTSRNLRVIELCRDFAETEEDQNVLDQFRPYILMMRTRALASQMVADDEAKAALFHIDEGLEELRQHFEESGMPEAIDMSSEVALLRGMRDELVKKLPASQKSELRERLQKAIEQENYELAAILRDELKQISE
ncbi:MAG: UvrB/UvrC motif-containing protein [Planctomycetota bacterium]